MLAVRSDETRPRARLSALGAHVPVGVETNDELAETVDTSDEWIRERTGIRERRLVAPDEAASDPGVLAAERLLADADRRAAEVAVLIVPTASPDHIFPSTAALIGHRIGASGAAAHEVSAGCTGFIYDLAQAPALVASGLARTVMVIGAEATARITDQSDRATCILFGDAAAGAPVVAGDAEETTGVLGFELGADGAGGPDLLAPAGASRHPMLPAGTRAR